MVQKIYTNKMQLLMSTFKEEKDEKRCISNKWQTKNENITRLY